MIDQTDLQIIELLRHNSKLQYRDISKHPMVVEANRISGDGCYILKSLAKSQNDLNELLDSILEYGIYRVNIVLTKIK